MAKLLCEVSQLAALRRDLVRWLTQTDLSDQTAKFVVLATYEAAANAIEHAATGESVEVRATIDEESLIVSVRDKGLWKHAPLDNDECARGRGLTMIRALIPSVSAHDYPSPR